MPLCCGESQSVELEALSLEEKKNDNNNDNNDNNRPVNGNGLSSTGGDLNYGTSGSPGKVNPFLINNIDKTTGETVLIRFD